MQQHEYDILNTLTDGSLIIDLDYNILFANQAIMDLCGVKEEEILGKNCHEIAHQCPSPCAKDCLPSLQCPHSKVFQTGLPVSITHRHLFPNGTEKIF